MLKSFNKIPNKNSRLTKQEERELIIKFQNENLDSFPIFYSHFFKSILKYVLKYIKQTSVAEEITQDVFLKVYQFRNSYNAEYDVSSWMWTIARNTIYDHLRQIRNLPPSFKIVQIHSELELEPAQLETAESMMIEEHEKRKLLQFMAALSKKQKQAIFLRLVKKFSYKEISNSMNLSLSAVKSLINRGKTSLIKMQVSTNYIPNRIPTRT